MLDSWYVYYLIIFLLIINHKAKRFTIIGLATMIKYTDIPENSFFKICYVCWNKCLCRLFLAFL